MRQICFLATLTCLAAHLLIAQPISRLSNATRMQKYGVGNVAPIQMANYSLSLLKQLSDSGNVCLSPYSLANGLALAYSGARNATFGEFSQALHLPESPDSIGRCFQGWNAELAQDTGVHFLNANALWRAKHIELEQQYLHRTKTYYKGEVYPLTTAAAINEWASYNTKGLIRQVVLPNSITPNSGLLLTNAIYFKSSWKSPFESVATHLQAFYSAPPVNKQDQADSAMVQMMHQTAKFDYALMYRAQWLVLPYVSPNWAMVIALPTADRSASAFIQQLPNGFLDSVMLQTQTHKVIVSLPRFSFKNNVAGIIPALQKMGIGKGFNPQEADFLGISKTPMYIGKISQQTVIEVNESGATAAAVTVVHMRTMSVSPEHRTSPVVFNANHPFAYFLVEKSTGLILFEGVVNNL